MSELTRRILFSLAGAPLTVIIIYAGGAVLTVALSILAGLGAWEFFRMARVGGSNPLDIAGIVLAACVPLLVYAGYLGVYRLPFTVGVFVLLTLLASVIWLRGVGGRPIVAVAVTVAGVMYPALLSYMFPIRYHDYAVGAVAGTVLVMFPIMVTWGTDTGAYVFGRLMGKRKLIPSVSPGKTVAGSVGGLLVAIVTCALYARFMLQPLAQLTLTPIGILAFAIAISVADQIGDLFESLIKRDAGVKDSSGLFPGHGGVLDRFDSLLFALPVAYLLLGHLLVRSPG